MSLTKISYVLGSYNRKGFLKLAVESIRNEIVNSGLSSEIIVIDGGSTDGTVDWLKSQKNIILILQHNRGMWKNKPIDRKNWGYFMNLGFKCSQGKYICMISDDCIILPGSVKNGVELFESELKNKKKIGSVAFYFRDWPYAKKYHVNINFEKLYVNHGLYLKSALEEVSFADEETYKFYGADIDMVMKMYDSGYNCIASKESFVEHFADANNLIKKSNMVTATEDAKNLKNKWKKYGEMGGEWKEIEFTDTNNIANSFIPLLISEYFGQFCRSPLVFIKSIINTKWKTN